MKYSPDNKAFMIIAIGTSCLAGFLAGANKYLKHHKLTIVNGERIVQTLDGNVVQEKSKELSYMQKISLASRGIDGGKIKKIRNFGEGENILYVIDTEKWRITTHSWRFVDGIAGGEIK